MNITEVALPKGAESTYAVESLGETIYLTKTDIRKLYEQTHTTITHHRLTSGLVSILVNLARTVHEKNRNDIHIYTEIGEVCGPQAYSGMSNITKLRFHALVFKVKNQEGKQIKGHWGITKKGGQFLRGEIEIPEFALTKDNHVESREGPLKHIKSLRPEGALEFEQKEDIRYSFKADEKGQGQLL